MHGCDRSEAACAKGGEDVWLDLDRVRHRRARTVEDEDMSFLESEFQFNVARLDLGPCLLVGVSGERCLPTEKSRLYASVVGGSGGTRTHASVLVPVVVFQPSKARGQLVQLGYGRYEFQHFVQLIADVRGQDEDGVGQHD